MLKGVSTNIVWPISRVNSAAYGESGLVVLLTALPESGADSRH